MWAGRGIFSVSCIATQEQWCWMVYQEHVNVNVLRCWRGDMIKRAASHADGMFGTGPFMLSVNFVSVLSNVCAAVTSSITSTFEPDRCLDELHNWKVHPEILTSSFIKPVKKVCLQTYVLKMFTNKAYFLVFVLSLILHWQFVHDSMLFAFQKGVSIDLNIFL